MVMCCHIVDVVQNIATKVVVHEQLSIHSLQRLSIYSLRSFSEITSLLTFNVLVDIYVVP